VNENRHGLSRDIPAEVQREIRQRCKFGCVICRRALYTYEHIDPPFSEALEHDPSRMCLLCGDCHGAVTRGVWSKEKVWAAYRRVRSDPSIYAPHHEFDLQGGSLEIGLGDCIFEQPAAVFKIDGQVVLGFSDPEYPGGLPLLSGLFCDDRGKRILTIERNAWRADAGSWDIRVEGPRISIWTAPRQLALKLKLIPPRSLRIERLNMRMGSAIVRQRELLEIVRETAGGEIVFGMSGRSIGASACVSIDTRVEYPTFRGIRMIGGQGTIVDGAGIVWAEGAGVQWLMKMTLNGQLLLDASTDFILGRN
jgi:hypothetical protein